MPEYAKVCQSMQEYARICQSMPEYARVCQSVREYARDAQDMLKICPRYAQNMPRIHSSYGQDMPSNPLIHGRITHICDIIIYKRGTVNVTDTLRGYRERDGHYEK